ncbi:MAG TPA: hypothetical protein VGH29_04355, partial [Candidatus Binataceae bacterium]
MKTSQSRLSCRHGGWWPALSPGPVRARRATIAALAAALWVIALIGQAGAGTDSPAPQSGPSIAPATAPGAVPATPPAAGHGELDVIIDAGTLSDLRWPNFANYRSAVKKFYETGGYALAWTNGGKPIAQAQAMIDQFRQAQLKGLDPQDYDASRWDARMAKLAPASAHPAPTDLIHFDLAMTVLAMRYISDLHLG